MTCKTVEATFKRRILHAPNRISELSACKMRRLNQLNASSVEYSTAPVEYSCFEKGCSTKA